jgi:hypothetical protein
MEQKWSRSRKPTAPKRKNNFDQHGDKEELYFRAQAFKKAAKTLVKAIEDGKMSRIPADILPVVLLYRQTIQRDPSGSPQCK